MLWAATILAFLGGVRRGLAFRTVNPPPAGAVAAALGLFARVLLALLGELVLLWTRA